MSEQREVTSTGHAKGEHHGRAVLTWEKVRAMRHEYVTGSGKITQRQLAAKWGVSQTTVHRILTNKNWIDPEYSPQKTGS